MLHAAGKPSRGPKCFAVPHAVMDEDGPVGPGHSKWSRHFDVYETNAIELDVHCLRPPDSALRVRLRLPNGDVYETLDAVASSQPEDSRRRRQRRTLVATARLPIAGSFVTQYGLLGAWSAQVCWTEDQNEACSRPLRFSLER